MEETEEKKQDTIKHISFEKVLFALVIVFFVFSLSLFLAGGWLYYTLTQTNDLPIYLSKKLSKPDKFTINIDSLKNTFPIITANNVRYDSLSKVSSLSFNLNELTIFPDYLSPKTGTHSFQISSGTMLFQKPKLLMNCDNIDLFGKYCNKQIYIASSTWNLYGGKIYLTGHIDTGKKPSTYELCGELSKIKLQDILARTKNKRTFTGEISGSISLNNINHNTTPPFGKAALSIFNGTYNKPELATKINSALHKIGLQSSFKDLADTVASSTFVLKGDFLIDGKKYATENAVIITSWSTIKFSGIIGPKSALNGTFIINYKNYSSFTIKVNGTNSKNLNYKISDSDKAHLTSIIFREISKGTEKRIKREGKRTNLRFNTKRNHISKRVKRFWNKL